jgi:hypothetical protein
LLSLRYFCVAVRSAATLLVRSCHSPLAFVALLVVIVFCGAGFLDLAILILESIPCAQLEKNGSTIGCNVIEKICVCSDKHADNEMHVEFQLSEAESGGLGSRRRNRTASRSSHEAQPSGYGSVIV